MHCEAHKRIGLFDHKFDERFIIELVLLGPSEDEAWRRNAFNDFAKWL